MIEKMPQKQNADILNAYRTKTSRTNANMNEARFNDVTKVLLTNFQKLEASS